MANIFKPNRKNEVGTTASSNPATPANPGSNPAAQQQKIAEVAYRLFEERGRSHGHEIEDWLAAERIVQGRASKSTQARQ